MSRRLAGEPRVHYHRNQRPCITRASIGHPSMRFRIFIYGRVLVGSVIVLFFPGLVYTLEFKLLWLPSLLLSYYLMVWMLAGRKPKPGVIVPRYGPPEGMSPAEMRYLLTGGSDRKSVAAVLVHLAAQEVVCLEPEHGGYRITLLVDRPPAGLAREEASAFDALAQIQSLVIPGKAPNPPRTLFLRPSDGEHLSLVASIVTGSLMRRVNSLYFKRNLRYTLPAVTVSIAMSLATAARIAHRDGAVFLTWIFLLFSLMLGLFLASSVLPAVRDTFRGTMNARNIALTLVPLTIFLGIPGALAVAIAHASAPAFALSLIAVVIVNVSGGIFIQTITPLARRRMDEVEGFREFLSTVELDRLDRMNDPHLTPALLNDYLAYAIALDLKEAWGNRLSNALFQTTTSAG